MINLFRHFFEIISNFHVRLEEVLRCLLITVHSIDHGTPSVSFYKKKYSHIACFPISPTTIARERFSDLVIICFLSFFSLNRSSPSYAEIFIVSQLSCCAPGSLWEMPDSNPGLLSPKFGGLTMSTTSSFFTQFCFDLFILWLNPDPTLLHGIPVGSF